MRTANLIDDVETTDGLDVAAAARAQLARTEAAQFDAVLAYLRQIASEPLAQAGGVNEWTRYGGSGTPSVSEYAVAEVGPVLGLSANGARALIADAVDLAYRLPRLYACLHDGSVDGWRIRRVARATREFTIAQAGDADRRLSAANVDGTPLIARITMPRLQLVLDQIRFVDDPEGAEKKRREARRRRGVTIWFEDGVAHITGTLTVDDGQRLDQRLDQLVESMRFLGDQRPDHILRSVAMGMVHEPDSLDDLYTLVADKTDGDTDDTEADIPAEPEPEPVPEPEPESEPEPEGESEPKPSKRRRSRRRGLRETVLYVHYDRCWGTWSLDDVGAITRTEAEQILGKSSRIVVKPVIDLETTISTTGYVAPPRLREQTALMNALTCTFPYCNRPAKLGDYDPPPAARRPGGAPFRNYADGGPTDSRNGHRLCRFHHRANTFTAWTVTSPAPGIWLWLSPAGRSYLVTAGTTTKTPRPSRHHRPREAKT
ncbi:13E12 repeat family protein [Nocardioidaceae bacterium SCSIO 66511]|nr:13E12 repeat family protein [Nocardioidaceae bacterium SCSIO 66511]